MKDEYKILYASPVGRNAVELLPSVVERFHQAGADVFLMQYDEGGWMSEVVGGGDAGRMPAFPVGEIPHAGLRWVKDKGYKWQLAMRHLQPDVVQEYDYIFLWDDDLDVRDFDAQRFVRIMAENFLMMAQPEIESEHELSHSITRAQACPPPCKDVAGNLLYPMGRLTNFVEVMAPVFSRYGWREFFSYLSADNKSGYGYDYIPMQRKGIIDAMPVIHTRAVQSMKNESFHEMDTFFKRHGLQKYPSVEMGALYE